MRGDGSVTWYSSETIGVVSIVVPVQLRSIIRDTLERTLEKNLSIGSSQSVNLVMTLNIEK